MLNKINRFFKNPRNEVLTLRFEMGMDENDNHIVSIWREKDNYRYGDHEIENLFSYNYIEEMEYNNRRYIYRVDEKDRQILSSLKSLNPIKTNNSLVFEIEPQVLNYLRGLLKTQD